MTKIWNYIFYCLLVVLFVALAACSPVNTVDNYAGTGLKVHGSEEYDQEGDIQFIPVESEQDLEEELIALEKTGDWSVGDWSSSERVNNKLPAENNSVDSDPVVDKVGEEVVYDFPITMNKQVEFYLDQFQNRQRKTFKRWLERSGKYLPAINEELKKANLPLDLAYLAMIESGYNPSAYSHAHAAGLWQFIRGTGRSYGLRIDSWVDERRDPTKATKSAIAYLSDLYERFGDWQLAVAAYNAGEGKIERGIKKYNATNFWELASHKYLHLETKRYVPKLIAAIIIARDPERYGFTDFTLQQPVQYDLIKVPSRTDLGAVAVSGSTSVKKLRKLNNDLRKDQTPPSKGTFALKIPAGSHDRIAANLPRAHGIATTKYKTHKVGKNDSLRKISKKYHISMTTLLKANKLHSSKLKVGQRVRIPYRSTKYVLLQKGQTPGEYYASNSGRMIMHELGQGETLSRVAKQYNVPVDMLVQWNDIKNVRRIRAGHQLAIYLDQADGSFQVAAAPASAEEVVILLADTKKRKPNADDNALIAEQQKQKALLPQIVATMPATETVFSLNESKKNKPGTDHNIVSNVPATETIFSLAESKKQKSGTDNNALAAVSLNQGKQNSQLDQILSTVTHPATTIISLSDNKKRKPAGDNNSINQETAVSYYKVRSGDSLWSIARKLHVTTLDIKRWNRLQNNKLQPGTRLVIKKS